MGTQTMRIEHIGCGVILIVLLILLLKRERYYRSRLRETADTLEEIIAGNQNRRIQVGVNEPLAPLIFKINRLIDSYQKDKIKVYRGEQARKQMLSSLSHDIRTPLTSVLGYLDFLCAGAGTEETDEYLHIAQKKAYDLKEYIDALFTIAQIDADEMPIVLEPIDLYELLRSELIGWLPKLQQEKITLDIQIPDAECLVNGDRHALIRIFNNLLQNAVRYGGCKYFLGVSAWADANYAYFEVWDKGPGLSPGEISQVFDRLYKQDSARTSQGHGLGLAIAKELTEKMNGKIVMESTPYIKTAVRVCVRKKK